MLKFVLAMAGNEIIAFPNFSLYPGLSIRKNIVDFFLFFFADFAALREKSLFPQSREDRKGRKVRKELYRGIWV